MGRIFYWLKLKLDFFREKRIRKLRKQAGGDTYTIIYLEMLLLSLPDEGVLYFDGVESNFAEELALELYEEVDDVRMTIAFLMAQGLMIQKSECEYLLLQVADMVGKECESASRVRKHRGKRKELEEKRYIVTEERYNVQNCNTEIDIESESEKESELHTEIDIDSGEIYRGEYGNVKLLDEEYKRLIEKFPDSYRERIDRLSRYIHRTAKHYPSHYATIVRWANEDAARGEIPDADTNAGGSFETESFFEAAVQQSYAGMK